VSRAQSTTVRYLVGYAHVSVNIVLLMLPGTFDVYIVENFCERASRLPFDKLFGDTELNNVFDTYGGVIMSRWAMREGVLQNTVLNFVRQVVAYLSQVQWVQDVNPETQRAQHTLHVCNLMTVEDTRSLRAYLTGQRSYKLHESIEDLSMSDIVPLFATASGDADLLFRNITTYTDLIRAPCSLFPNALDAAVAFDVARLIATILKYLRTNVRGKQDFGSCEEMRTAAHAIGNDLRLAIRLHKKAAANLLFDFLAENPIFGDSMHCNFSQGLIDASITHGNMEHLYAAMEYKHNRLHNGEDFARVLIMVGDYVETIFQKGHKRLTLMLICTGYITPTVSTNLLRTRHRSVPL
jgi:hypothetical protein